MAFQNQIDNLNPGKKEKKTISLWKIDVGSRRVTSNLRTHGNLTILSDNLERCMWIGG